MAAAESERYHEWLSGPTAAEKADWARKERARRYLGVRSWEASAPTPDEVEEWAQREVRRRRAWAEQQDRPPYRSQRYDDERGYHLGFERGYEYDDARRRQPGSYDADREAAYRWRREGELAAEGVWSWLADLPYWLWGNAVAAGRDYEDGITSRSRRRRVPLYDD